MIKRHAVIAAGGTGGHIFPAQALAEVLGGRGWRIALATDERGARFADGFPAERRIALSAATASLGNPVKLLGAGVQIARGVMQARAQFRVFDPSVVVGFGGYPSLPGLLAALSQKRPTILHEQNAVLGKVNRLLASHVTELASAFPTLEKTPSKVQPRLHVVGNPIRPPIRQLAGRDYSAPSANGPLRILVTGGSQGARLLSECVPTAIAQLPEALRLRLEVQQQTRPESMDLARRIYADALVRAEVAPYFQDMASRLSAAHLVIGRAGASTVSEMAVSGCPSILVPLKIAVDDHQTHNAKLLTDAGAAVALAEDDLTAEVLCSQLLLLLADPDRLLRMARAARSVAIVDAADRLADLVEHTAMQFAH